ncbi:hypothetical protein O181_095168 [Austropuccinia psidii MF-1]|uniref:Uncharacterized protein n=1 Tax=Austropuccinia psidii MF-1 TaxID=1389203 RepID=A0A9Q3PAY0_9BASI|nr:hypothetical protein [Austropuccinia psidii MF-1]
MKHEFIPTKYFIYQPFKNWLARFLQRAGIMEILHQHQQSQIPKGSPKFGIWDGLVWRHLTGTRNIHKPPFMSIPGSLAFSIYVDWLNAHEKSTRWASIGPIMLICLNLPPSERLKPENVYVAGIIPGPKEPTALQLNYQLMPLIQDLKELWQGYHFSPTSIGPSGSFVRVSILTGIADVIAMCKITGFISHSGNHFCNFCTIHKAQIEDIGPQFHYMRSYQNHKSTLAKWLGHPHNKEKQFFLSMECYIQFWKTLCIGMQPEWSRRKSNETNTSDSYSMTSKSSLDKITLRKARSLRKDAEKIITESLPTTSTQKNYLPMPTPHTQDPSSGSAEIPSFDADYIPTSEIPSELDISALSDHQIKGEALENL